MKNQKIIYILVAIIFVVLTLSIVLFLINHNSNNPIANTTDETSANNPIETTPDDIKVVLLGVEDNDYLDYLTLISINNTQKKITFLTIPSDTYINPDVSGYDATKICDLYKSILKVNGKRNESFEKTLLVLAKSIEVQINDYMLLSYDNIKDFVKKFDGINYDVKNDIKYDDDERNIHVDLQKGMKVLNGDEVISLLKSSQTENGIIKKNEIYLSFIKDAVKDIYSRNKKIDFYAKCLELFGNIDTSIGNNLTNYVEYLFNMGVNDSSGKDNIDVLVLSGSEIADLDNNKFYVINKQKATVDVGNILDPKHLKAGFDFIGLFTTTNETYISENYYAKED